MGLFSRKSAAADARPRARPSISSEAQARELRVRARRRLIGALALVLAVVIVVPMLFDTTQESMIVVPMVVAPAVDDPLTQVPESGSTDGGMIIASDDAPAASPVQPSPTSAPTPGATRPQPTQSTPPRNPASNAPPPPAHTANPATNTAGTPARALPRATAAPPAQDARTDDGAVALALLEGRQPPSAGSPASPNSFVLQIAAYTAQQDALARRDRLVQSGISDVRVETTRVNGKNTYRVRVGPFSTREAAQAAQARIRALGDYEDAYITRQ